MRSGSREEPLYKNKALWGIVGIFMLFGVLAYVQANTTWFIGAAPASGAVANLKEQQIPDVAQKMEMKKRKDLSAGVRIVFSDADLQADFEKISSNYAECLKNSNCAIRGSLWDLYSKLQDKSEELGEENVKYYTVNLLNHMLRKMEVAKGVRQSYRSSARRIIVDMHRDSFAVTPSWIILADLAYQAGDLREAKDLYKQTLSMSQQPQLDFENQIDVDTLMRVKNRCLELGCEVTASLDPAGS